jgi:hypothetical protein
MRAEFDADDEFADVAIRILRINQDVEAVPPRGPAVIGDDHLTKGHRRNRLPAPGPRGP